MTSTLRWAPTWMKRSTFLGWLPISLLCTFLSIALVWEAFSPSSFCTPVDPGGKEHVCGFDYSAPLVQAVTNSFYFLFFGALLLSAFLAFRQRLSKAGVLGLVIAVVIVIIGFVMRAHFGAEDSP